MVRSHSLNTLPKKFLVPIFATIYAICVRILIILKLLLLQGWGKLLKGGVVDMCFKTPLILLGDGYPLQISKTDSWVNIKKDKKSSSSQEDT